MNEIEKYMNDEVGMAKFAERGSSRMSPEMCAHMLIESHRRLREENARRSELIRSFGWFKTKLAQGLKLL